jgi:hypothetical protein
LGPALLREPKRCPLISWAAMKLSRSTGASCTGCGEPDPLRDRVARLLPLLRACRFHTMCPACFGLVRTSRTFDAVLPANLREDDRVTVG